MPGLRRILAGLKDAGVPRVYFLKGSAPYLDHVRTLDAEAFGVDWTLDLAIAARAYPGKAVQGNLDPLCLFGSHEEIRRRALEICRAGEAAPPATSSTSGTASCRRRRSTRRDPGRDRAGVPQGGLTMALDVPRELLQKHDKPGPRYTSYPTVPAWTQRLRRGRLPRGAARAGGAPGRRAVGLPAPALLRQALPLLRLQRRRHQPSRATRRRLPRPRRARAGRGGGRAGSGPARRAAALGRRHAQLPQGPAGRARPGAAARRASPSTRGGEISIEVDPRIGTPEQARFLRAQGFNRISLGVQDFEPAVQKAIGRLQKRDRTLRAVPGLPRGRLRGVNLDLVYGLPEQTRESFERTLRDIIELGPDRVACFSYAHVPWVRPHQKLINTDNMPSGFEKFELFRLAIDLFAEAGYDWIGIDHFAQRDDELAVALRERRLHRNFMGYTTRPAPHMLAFGMSGIGDVCDRFIQNDAELDGYQAAIDAGRLPIVKGHRLTDDDRLRRLAILNLMCNLELPYALTVPGFGAPADVLLADGLARLRPYVDEGFVEFLPDRVRVTGPGALLRAQPVHGAGRLPGPHEREAPVLQDDLRRG